MMTQTTSMLTGSPGATLPRSTRGLDDAVGCRGGRQCNCFGCRIQRHALLFGPFDVVSKIQHDTCQDHISYVSSCHCDMISQISPLGTLVTP